MTDNPPLLTWFTPILMISMRLPPFLFYALIVALVSLCVTTARGKAISEEEQKQIYDEAVHILGGNGNVISRWRGDIRYLVVGSKHFRQQAVKSLQETVVETGIQIGELPIPLSTNSDLLSLYDQHICKLKDFSPATDSCANFVIIQSDRDEMLALAKRIPLRKVYQQSLIAEQPVYCFFAPFVSARQSIELAFIYIDSELDAAMLDTCLSEEIFQSFGLFNDFSGAHYFSFNNIVEPKQITQFDRLLLRTLYNSDFAPGTPVFTVMQRFMNELKSN